MSKQTDYPCPFCGHEAVDIGDDLRQSPVVACLEKGCPIEGQEFGVEQWETRLKFICSECEIIRAELAHWESGEEYERMTSVAARDGLQALAQYERAQKAEAENAQLRATIAAQQAEIQGEGERTITDDLKANIVLNALPKLLTELGRLRARVAELEALLSSAMSLLRTAHNPANYDWEQARMELVNEYYPEMPAKDGEG